MIYSCQQHQLHTRVLFVTFVFVQVVVSSSGQKLALPLNDLESFPQKKPVEKIRSSSSSLAETRELAGCNVDNNGWIGDGWCDKNGGYNTEACGWDGGDCCEETCGVGVGTKYDCSEPMECLDPAVLKDSSNAPGVCRGYFCDKHIDDIFILMTHNSASVRGDMLFPNQNYREPDQFRFGIRGFSMDLWEEDGELTLRHGQWGEVNYVDRVKDILVAMDENGQEYEFLLIQIEDYLKTDVGIALACNVWGDKLITNFDSSKPLGDYIGDGKRVLIMTHDRSHVNAAIGMHNSHALLSENEYEWYNTGQAPDYTYRRGPRGGNQRYARMMNYFCQDNPGFGSEDKSKRVNARDRMQCHADEFKKQDYAKGIINVMMIDFYELGNVMSGQEAIRNELTDYDQRACDNLRPCKTAGSCSFFNGECGRCCSGSSCRWWVFDCKCDS